MLCVVPRSPRITLVQAELYRARLHLLNVDKHA